MAGAVRVALDLLHVPSRARLMRSSPLPLDVRTLLEIAAGDEAALEDAARATGRASTEIKEAAEFFIEQVILSPDSDSYRTLGSVATASTNDLRRNMASLQQWLHPDKKVTGDRSVFVIRINRAWENLKTPERRQAYDSALDDSKPARSKKPTRVRNGAIPKPSPREGVVLGALRRIFRSAPR